MTNCRNRSRTATEEQQRGRRERIAGIFVARNLFETRQAFRFISEVDGRRASRERFYPNQFRYRLLRRSLPQYSQPSEIQTLVILSIRLPEGLLKTIQHWFYRCGRNSTVYEKFISRKAIKKFHCKIWGAVSSNVNAAKLSNNCGN